MKIVHWAIIFLVIVIPFSIVCKNAILKRTLVVHDETRINNILDNATYDAVNQIIEVSEELGYGKNIPITKNVAMASINRFFQSLAVNFNFPSKVESAKDYFGQYIPVIIIVGYDGLYVYSYDSTESGYKYVLKPKIPYAYTDSKTGYIINFTLGNELRVYIPGVNVFMDGYYYVGSTNTTNDGSGSSDNNNEYEDDIAGLDSIVYDLENGYSANDVITKLPNLTTNISYILKTYKTINTNPNSDPPSWLYEANVDVDYQYDNYGDLIDPNASTFHKLRRDTIINLITATLRKEINEHDTFAKMIGVNYDFYIPNISKEDWTNTVDDISVLAFFQGMPIGADSYYNNHSLGGARIVKRNYIYATEDGLYHKFNCPRLNGLEEDENGELPYKEIFINAYDAHQAGYWACELCR